MMCVCGCVLGAPGIPGIPVCGVGEGKRHVGRKASRAESDGAFRSLAAPQLGLAQVHQWGGQVCLDFGVGGGANCSLPTSGRAPWPWQGAIRVSEPAVAAAAAAVAPACVVARPAAPAEARCVGAVAAGRGAGLAAAGGGGGVCADARGPVCVKAVHAAYCFGRGLFMWRL